jgi:hypothetical protein
MMIKTDKETTDRMAWLLRKEIGKNAESSARFWLGEKLDREMWDVTVSDTEDLICVHNLIEEGEISLAFESACNLDTAVRDVITKEVWNWMSMVHADHKEHWARLDDGAKYNA